MRGAAVPAPAEATLARRSFLSGRVFPAFAWGLSLHSLVIAALFGLFALPETGVRAIAAWKEVGLAMLLVYVALRALTGRGPKNVIAWPDVWIGGLMMTAVLFLLTENLWLRFNLPPTAEYLGIRDAVYFMLIYFVGRATPDLVTDERTMRTLFRLLVITSAIGIAEWLFVSPDMLVALGVAAYFQDFLGVSAFTLGNEYGLPVNYWTSLGGHFFRRAGSVYLSGQGFAVPFLLLFPIATAWVFLREHKTKLMLAGYLICVAGLLLTLTRTTIFVALIQVTLLVSMRRKPEWAVAGLTMAGAVFIAAFILLPGFPTFVWETFSWQEGSSVSHSNDWASGLASMAQHPWGSGLGTADQTAVRAGLEHITGDNLYLKYGVELGLAGLALLIFILSGIGSAAMDLYRRGSAIAERRMGMALWLATIGIAINGMTAVVFNSVTLGWLFFWLAGAAVSAAQRLPQQQRAPAVTAPLSLDGTS